MVLLLLSGWLLGIVTEGSGLTIPPWPMNLYLLIGFALTLALMALTAENNRAVAWLASIPVAICSIAFMGLLSLIAGILPQDPEFGGTWVRLLGFNYVFTSWPFAFSILFLLSNLGIAAFRRLYTFKSQNLRFVLNHAGLWIVIAGGTIGASDLQRLRIYVNEGETTSHAMRQQRQAVSMPFDITLQDFRMELYPPKMTFVDRQTGSVLLEGPAASVETIKGASLNMSGWQVQVLKFLPTAIFRNGGYEASSEVEAAPAAQVQSINTYTRETKTGWISSGSSFARARYFEVGHAVLVMTTPQPKKYQSEVILREAGRERHETLEVNKPIAIAGWKLYQLSYDEKLGQWSKLSIIEAIRDPWLPFVYLGIAMLMLGTLQILWSGTRIRGVNES